MQQSVDGAWDATCTDLLLPTAVSFGSATAGTVLFEVFTSKSCDNGNCHRCCFQHNAASSLAVASATAAAASSTTAADAASATTAAGIAALSRVAVAESQGIVAAGRGRGRGG